MYLVQSVLFFKKPLNFDIILSKSVLMYARWMQKGDYVSGNLNIIFRSGSDPLVHLLKIRGIIKSNTVSVVHGLMLNVSKQQPVY